MRSGDPNRVTVSAVVERNLSDRAHAIAAERTVSLTELITCALERELAEEARCSVCRTHTYREQKKLDEIDNLDQRVSILAATVRDHERKLEELTSLPGRLAREAVRSELWSLATEIVEHLMVRVRLGERPDEVEVSEEIVAEVAALVHPEDW